MKQSDLFPPRTHRDDPGSSHDAEAKTRKTWGAKHDDLVMVLSDDDNAAGLTASQIAAVPFIVRSGRWPDGDHERLCEVRKRLSDLLTRPDVIKREHTKGDRESVWRVLEPWESNGVRNG